MRIKTQDDSFQSDKLTDQLNCPKILNTQSDEWMRIKKQYEKEQVSEDIDPVKLSMSESMQRELEKFKQ